VRLALPLALFLGACSASSTPHCGGCDAGEVCVGCDAGSDCSKGEVCAPLCSVEPDGGSSCAAGQQCVMLPPADPYMCCAGCPCAAPHDDQVCR
jgi:hypothetical protein